MLRMQKRDYPENKTMENVINQENTFTYRYSAKENTEIKEIRKRYLPQSESKLDELKRLDAQVRNAGMIESLCVGIIGCFIFGLGMCLAMQVIENGVFFIVLGVLLGIVGIISMAVAYPVYRRSVQKAKSKYAPRILQLTDELMIKNDAKRVLFMKDGEVFHQIYKGNRSTEDMFENISDALTMVAKGGELHE